MNGESTELVDGDTVALFPPAGKAGLTKYMQDTTAGLSIQPAFVYSPILAWDMSLSTVQS